jgi:hypothetical protein
MHAVSTAIHISDSLLGIVQCRNYIKKKVPTFRKKCCSIFRVEVGEHLRHTSTNFMWNFPVLVCYFVISINLYNNPSTLKEAEGSPKGRDVFYLSDKVQHPKDCSKSNIVPNLKSLYHFIIKFTSNCHKHRPAQGNHDNLRLNIATGIPDN